MIKLIIFLSPIIRYNSFPPYGPPGVINVFKRELPVTGPETACVTSMRVAKKGVRDWSSRDHSKH
jgi:hypothetical protein